jgi:hypothetical protein
MTGPAGGSRSPAVSDAAIRAMLEDRAGRLRPVQIDVPAIVTGVVTRPRRAGWFATIAPRVSVAVAAAMVLVVGSALTVGSLRDRPASSVAPTGASEAPPAIASAATGGVRALGAAELGDLARTRSAELAPRIVVVRGVLTVTDEQGRRCATPTCATGQLLGAGGGLELRLTSDLVAEFADVGSPTIAGPFAVRFTTESADGRPVVEVLDRLITDQANGWTSSTSGARAVDPEGGPAFAAVDGWLVRTPFLPCPTNAGGTVDRGGDGSISVSDCPNRAYLTDIEFQPLQPDGSSIGTAAALSLPSGSYEDWAPDPAPFGEGGVMPRRAVYLLHREAISCNTLRLEECSRLVVGAGWTIVARLEPIP